MLSLVIYVVIVDWIMRRVNEEDDVIDWVANDRLPGLAYGDDKALLSIVI